MLGRLGVLSVALCSQLLLLSACDSPTSPRDSLLLEGVLEFEGEVVHAVSVSTTGVTNFETVALQPVLVDVTSFDPDTITLAVGVGRFDEGECETTTQFLLPLDEVRFVTISDRDYCVTVSDIGVLPEDALVRYAIHLEVQD